MIRRVLTAAARSPSGGNTQPWNAVLLTGEPLADLTAKIKAKAATAPMGEGHEYDIYPKGLEGRYEDQRRIGHKGGGNVLVIRIQPDEGISLRIASKIPGPAVRTERVKMDFSYSTSFGKASPEAYERLILDVLLGDPPLFPRHEEVELSWKILDPIEEFWASQGQPEQYAPGSWGM